MLRQAQISVFLISNIHIYILYGYRPQIFITHAYYLRCFVGSYIASHAIEDIVERNKNRHDQCDTTH